MEVLIKKYQQRFRKIRDEMNRWEAVQARFVSQFRNASSITERLQEIQDSRNYGNLKLVSGIGDAVLRNQLDQLETLLLSMKITLEEFHGIVLSFEKIQRDAKQLVKGGSSQPSMKQLQRRIGINPCLADCFDGLSLLYDMHQSEYDLKTSLLSGLSVVVMKPSAGDLSALQQLLIDQPNIPKDEVQHIFDIIFAEEISR